MVCPDNHRTRLRLLNCRIQQFQEVPYTVDAPAYLIRDLEKSGLHHTLLMISPLRLARCACVFIQKPGRPESAIQDRTTPVDHRTAGGLVTFERRFSSQSALFQR